MTRSKVFIPLILNTVLLSEWSTAVCVFSDSCSWVSCLSWTVKLSCSSEKSFRSHKSFGFPAFLCIWTLSSSDCMILRSIFSHWGWLRDSYAAITEGSNTHWCSRRKKHALRAGAWKLLNRMKMCTCFLFCLNIIFFHLVLPFRGYTR